MPNHPDNCYHVTLRAKKGRILFETDQDYWACLDLIRREVKSTGCRLAAWCLLPASVELLGAGDSGLLRLLVRRVTRKYGQYCNVRFDREGAVWSRGAGLQPLMSGFELPVMMQMETAGGVRPAEDYEWSSAGAHVMGNDALGLLDLSFSDRFADAAAWSALLESHFSLRCGHAVAA
jgi:hypothetical protein